MSLAHLFVTLGPLSALAAREIIMTHLDPLTEDVVVLALSPVESTLFPQKVVVRQRVRSERDGDPWREPFLVAQWFSRELTRLRGFDRFVLYTSHLFEVPSNYLFYFDPRVVRREMLPDGLSNYIPRPLLPHQPRKALGFFARLGLRIASAKRYGLHYRPLVRGDITQFDAALSGAAVWDCTWTFRAEGLVTKRGQLRVLSYLPNNASVARRSALLVLDQGLQDIASPDLQAALRRSLVAHVEQRRGWSIYYKPHPRRPSKEHLFHRAGIEITVLRSGNAERQIRELGISEIVGFYSTPLLLVDDPDITRNAVLPRPDQRGVLRPDYVDRLRRTLSNSGARVLDASATFGPLEEEPR